MPGKQSRIKRYLIIVAVCALLLTLIGKPDYWYQDTGYMQHHAVILHKHLAIELYTSKSYGWDFRIVYIPHEIRTLGQL